MDKRVNKIINYQRALKESFGAFHRSDTVFLKSCVKYIKRV